MNERHEIKETKYHTRTPIVFFYVQNQKKTKKIYKQDV
jgi:hypothetical protein